LTSITDAKDQTTTFHRDLQGRVHQKVFFDDTTINYVYEDQSGPNTAGATSRLESSTDALNRRTNYTYFKDNNLDEVRYSDTADNPLNPPTPTVGYTYDEDYNRLKKIWIDGVIETEYEYYPVSVLGAGKVQSIDGPLTDDIIGFTYDKLGRVVEQSINDVTQSIDYDSLGRLSNTKSDVLGSIDRSYDGLTRRLQAVNYPNGQTTNYTYFGNTHDRRLEILENLDSGSMNLSKFDYTYDDEGQIMSWTSLLGATTSGRWFEYDDARQLLSARNASDFNSATHVYGYGYDPAGNRIIDSISNPQDEGSATSNSYSVNTVNAIETISIQNGMLSWEAVLVYDLAGNMTDDGQGKTFEWDAANRVVAVNYVGTTKRSEFTYDGLCRRVKIVEKTGSTVTSTKQFVWMGARIAQERDANDEVTRRYYPEGEERIKSGRARPYYYTRDHLGSIRELTDGSGNVQARYDYDPYGKQTKLNGALDVDFGYTGNYFHASSGLNLTLFRAYNPALGRWLSRDPIGEAVGLNLYGYVGNNSLRLVDPLGLTEEDPQGFGDADIVSTMGGPRGLYVAGQAPGIVRDTIIDGVTDVGTAVTPGEKLLLGIFKWFKKGKKCGVAYDYAPRVRARGVEDGVGHNFPYSFDNAILQTNPTIQPDGSWLYRMPGTINNTDGVFEIALNPETRTIFHRFFRGN
jgi:RHS repeat-associated protein